MTRQIRLPRNINEVLSGKLQTRVSESNIPVPPGWDIYVTDSNKGYARSNSQTCTVPTHSYQCDHPNHVIYYIAHELAHAWVHVNGGDISKHGKAFYKEFKRLCPPSLWHYEIGYKKHHAVRAGIDTIPAKNINAANGGLPTTPRRTFRPSATDADVKREAIRRDPRLKKKLAGLPDDKVRGYINGWFKKPSKA